MGIDGRRQEGKDLGGLMHDHMVRLVGMDGKEGKELGGLRYDHMVRLVGMDGRGKVGR